MSGSHSWGSFEFEEEGTITTFKFTKQGNEKESGASGYMFGRTEDCDFISNGTFVNGTRIGTGNTVRLANNDEVCYILDQYKTQNIVWGKFKFIKGEVRNDMAFSNCFKLGKSLGVGNFAEVFQATDKATGATCAVKVIRKLRNAISIKLERSLEREIGILMGISHTRFTEPETRHIFQQIFSGVRYLHSRGIVHRDLKPENILVMDAKTMTVKISDFGLAKVLDETALLSTTCGTPNYVAPEIIRKEMYGKAVDMWSLGVVFYVCLCGFPPFSDDLAPPRLRAQVLENKYTFPSPYWDEISNEAVNLVQDLLRLNANERLTAEEALSHKWMNLEARWYGNTADSTQDGSQAASRQSIRKGHDSASAQSCRPWSGNKRCTVIASRPIDLYAFKRKWHGRSTADSSIRKQRNNGSDELSGTTIPLPCSEDEGGPGGPGDGSEHDCGESDKDDRDDKDDKDDREDKDDKDNSGDKSGKDSNLTANNNSKESTRSTSSLDTLVTTEEAKSAKAPKDQGTNTNTRRITRAAAAAGNCTDPDANTIRSAKRSRLKR
ncbi:hypothetical protein BG011_000428 [Mortierella polycephala]|uniref:Protein kinase domain-containing protein n=1 Tax=Mortierella polycephala TaxID=41804 RepID=A0A9P6Q6Y6_9FUNG|nr:hypothetical protein BG011_000428 [Mortierella polycephala]